MLSVFHVSILHIYKKKLTKCLTPLRLWKTKGKAIVVLARTLAATGAAVAEAMMLAVSIVTPIAGAAR